MWPDGPTIPQQQANIVIGKMPAKDPDRVILLEMKTCTEVTTLYVAKPDEGISEATLSSQGWLAIARGITGVGTELLIMDPEQTSEVTIPGGTFPAWSRDGEWIAFGRYQDGLYVSKKDGSDIQKLVDNPFVGAPSWSPEGN